MTTTTTQIYAYTDEDRYEGRIMANKKPRLKIGATERDAKIRIDEQDGTSQPVDLVVKKVYTTTFWDIPFHDRLEDRGFKRVRKNREWFEITVEELDYEIKLYSDFLKSDYRETLKDFKPRFGQEEAIANITQNLLKYNKCLFAGHTGIGKTLISEIATLRYFSELNKGGLVLVTTPIPDTLNSFIDNLNTINVGHTQFQKYSYITKKEWDDLSITDICKRKKEEVIFLLITAQDLFYDDKTGSKIRNKYKSLDGCVDLWLRDEGHKFYRGDRTSTLLDCINSTSTLDLSATPYNFLDTYNDETIVNYDLLWGLNNRQETKLPKISIESYETPFAGVNDRIKKAYNVEEGYDPRKWFVRDDDGAYEYIEDIKETYHQKYVEVLPKKKNHLAVNLPNISKRASIDVLPAGEDEDSAIVKYPQLANSLNQCIKTRHFIDAWSLENMSKKTKLTLEECVDKLLEKYPAISILTCRKFTTGTDIPQVGHINLFDKISSPTEISQLIGRAIRKVDGKNKVKLYNHCPGSELELTLGISARKSSKLSGESEIEYLDSIPFTKYPLNSTKPKLISAQEIISLVQEYYESISSPKPNTNALTNALLEMDQSFYDRIDLTRLGKYKNPIKGTKKLNDPNKSKVKTITSSGVGFNSTSDVVSKVRELLIAIGIEMAWVSYVNKTYDPLKVLDSQEMKLMFDDYPLSIARAVIMNNAPFQFFTKFLDEKKQAYNDRPFGEVHDSIFLDTDRKRKIGLVYVPMDLAYEMVIDKNIEKLYNEGARNFLILNGLSGSIAYAASLKYPDANLFCVEYYSYFKNHLTNLAPNIFVDTIDKTDLTYSQYENMKFDVTLTNPPYQSENKTGKKGTGGNNALYPRMVKNTIDRVKDGGIVLQITPPAGLLKSTEFGKPSNLLKKIIDEGSLVKIDLTIKQRYFSHIGSAICSWIFIKGGKQEKVEVISEKDNFFDELQDLYYLGVSANRDFKKIEHEIYKKIISNNDGDVLEVVRGKKISSKECTMARKGYPKIQKGGHSDPKQVLGFDMKFHDFMTSQLGLWLINYISRHDMMIYHNLLSGIKIPKNGFNLTDEEKVFIDSEKWVNFDKNG